MPASGPLTTTACGTAYCRCCNYMEILHRTLQRDLISYVKPYYSLGCARIRTHPCIQTHRKNINLSTFLFLFMGFPMIIFLFTICIKSAEYYYAIFYKKSRYTCSNQRVFTFSTLARLLCVQGIQNFLGSDYRHFWQCNNCNDFKNWCLPFVVASFSNLRNIEKNQQTMDPKGALEPEGHTSLGGGLRVIYL